MNNTGPDRAAAISREVLADHLQAKQKGQKARARDEVAPDDKRPQGDAGPGLVRVRVEAKQYRLPRPEGEPDQIVKHGEIVDVPAAELARAPWVFRAVDEIEAEAAEAAAPTTDASFERLRQARMDEFKAQRDAVVVFEKKAAEIAVEQAKHAEKIAAAREE